MKTSNSEIQRRKDYSTLAKYQNYLRFTMNRKTLTIEQRLEIIKKDLNLSLPLTTLEKYLERKLLLPLQELQLKKKLEEQTLTETELDLEMITGSAENETQVIKRYYGFEEKTYLNDFQ